MPKPSIDSFALGGAVAGDTHLQASWPHPLRAWLTVWVLMSASAIAFVDRQILSLLVQPIQQALSISDTEFSLLSGVAFVLFYTVASIPIAWLADRVSRRNLIAVCLVSWGGMTLASGLATSLPSLFAARVGVGVGEAGLLPAAYSIISDSFPLAKRAPAIAVFSTGTILGVGVALLVGGAVAQWAAETSPIVLPLLGRLEGWQLAFMIVALPGPILALIVLGLREPVRQDADALRPVGGQASAILFLSRHGTLFFLLTAGYAMVAMAFACFLLWIPAVMARTYGQNMGNIGAMFGSMVLVCTGGGIIVGGWWVRALELRGCVDAVIRVSLAGAVIALPFTILVPLSPNGQIAFMALAGMCVGWGLIHPMAAAAIQAIAPNRLRARLAALYQLCFNVIAFVLGPTIVAVISDHVFKNPEKIGVALALISGVAIPIGMLLLFMARPLFISHFVTVENELSASATS